MLSSYPSIYAVGHKYLAELFSGPVLVEEKIDGSQFSFGVEPTLAGGMELKCRSKGQEIYCSAPEKMFAHAVATATRLYQAGLLRVGWTYRCEYLQKPKHNCLVYTRVPKNHLILFDVMTGPETYIGPEAKFAEAGRLGLECVPSYYYGLGDNLIPQSLENYFVLDSVLGGCKIEGVVVKNYNRFGIDKKILIGKFVSAAFKEKHAGEWRKSNPTKADVVEFLVTQLRTDARWRKAIQHLREAGKITDTPADIGPLLLEIKTDIEREEADAVKEALFKHFWPQIARGATSGFPEFYKRELGILS